MGGGGIRKRRRGRGQEEEEGRRRKGLFKAKEVKRVDDEREEDGVNSQKQ
jgi:hypothetical protein